MIRIISLVFLCCGFAAFLTINAIGPMSGNHPSEDEERQKLWEQVDKDLGNGRPKSAIAKLKEIYQGASSDEAYPEAALALCRRIILEGQIDQPVRPYMIKHLQLAIPDAPESMQPVLKTLLAEWYFGYYMENRWRFMRRSQTATIPGDDFETWDLARLLNEIDKHFTDALADADALRKIPVSEYERLIEKGTVTDAHRPTLYDFIAFEALNFYSMDEQFIRQQKAFEISADSPVFAQASGFLNWSPETGDTDSYLLKAVRLYQELLRFHADDEDRTAWLDANLGRLEFARSVTSGDESVSRYQAALRRFADANVSHPLSASALASLSQSLQTAGDNVQALRVAEQGLARFPQSPGGRHCYNQVQQIRARSSSAETERVWNSDTASVDVRYRNVKKVWFRLIKFDYENWRNWGNHRSPQQIYGDEQLANLRNRPVAEWSVDLPETTDYQERTETVPVDVDVSSGCYLLVCSHDQRFSQKDNQISVAEVWVSKLAVIMRQGPGRHLQGHVLDSVSGEPLQGVSIRKTNWKYDGRNSRETKRETTQTDENGFFRVPQGRDNLTRLLFANGDQKFGLIDHLYASGDLKPSRSFSSTVFFTDRAIYRPGQSVHFKGICASANQEKNRYQTISGKSVTVVLYDTNNQEVEKRTFRSNEFGSFSGSFTAPRGRATGNMRLRCLEVPGATSFRVEEYKRPRFLVKIDKPEDAFRLGQTVRMTGNATAYTGAPIDSSQVSWRVVRNVHYPSWYHWRYWYMPMNQNSQEIAHGESVTDFDGKFEVEFEASPDSSVPREHEPVFYYAVYADVTDTAGETRSAEQTTRIGFTSLQASLEAEKWQTVGKAVELSVRVATLDDEGRKTTGQLKVYRLTPPDSVRPARLSHQYYRNRKPDEIDPDLSRINNWPLGELVHDFQLTTEDSGDISSSVDLDAGAYKAVFETTDPAGEKVFAETPLVVHDPESDRFAVRVPHYLELKSETVEPGEDFVAVWGTGYESGRAFIEFEHRGKTVQSFWTEPGSTQSLVRFPVLEKHRGGLQMRVSYVRENRAYLAVHRIDVPWSSKNLTVRWEHFVSKLQPGGKETWTAVVTGPDAQHAVAEMVAGLYDASLDAFVQHPWRASFQMFYTDHNRTSLRFFNHEQAFNHVFSNWQIDWRDASVLYRHFSSAINNNGYWGSGYHNSNKRVRGLSMGGGGGFGGDGMPEAAMDEDAPPAAGARMALAGETATKSDFSAGDDSASGPTSVDLTQVSARKNLQETAFFYPHLSVGENGTVRIQFEVPEALTKWNFMGFTHDSELRAALLKDEMTTSKDLMVQPNPPRFLREGDVLEFSVKVINQSDNDQSGSVRLTLANARNGEVVDVEFDNQQPDQGFEIAARQSKSLYWKIRVPDFTGVLTYKAVGATAVLSDGEEGFLPVLSKRILVTESLPLPVRGNQTKTFDFDRLRLAGESDTLKSQTLTVQMTSNPVWYAVMALPYLMEYPHECSEQVFNRLYANALARHIVTSDPKIERVFEQWRGTEALDSPLEKNDDLRNVLIAESPWLLAGKKESQARRDTGILFEENRLNLELQQTLTRLTQMQHSDGSWPWFPGGRANNYITLYVTTGFGRLRHLGVDVDVATALKASDRLDWWIDQQYREIKRQDRLENNHLSPTVCMYLYGRSFFLEDRPVDEKYREAVDYFTGQAKTFWVELGNRQSQGHLAIALKRMGDRKTPDDIMVSLTERSLNDDEMGMFWREGDQSWWWYRAPIETQALMIEAYDEVAGDMDKVEELKIWLLKQKQTQNWKTTKATADACYGLLLRGTDLLASDELVTVKLGGTEIRPETVEAGTGFFEQRFVRGEIKPEMGQIELAKSDDGIAWGSIHWQYLEEVGKIEPWEGTPLTLKKSLFIKRNTEKGPVVEAVEGPVAVGDELVMRVELRVDRAMEYVHLKDYRGSGTEPVNVLSRYRFQDGLAYYESTRDTASHFFIDYLPRGTYVFEYPVRVQHRGVYETGIAELQCMYAPEFNSHSGSVSITVE